MNGEQRAGSDAVAAWDDGSVPRADYERIAGALASAESPVGIDAKHTHVLILHALDRIEKRLTRIEKRLESDGANLRRSGEEG